MAAYAALVSVMHIIEQIQTHPRPPISLDKTQVESLTEYVTFLQEFLESYPHDGSKEADSLESCIAMAAYVAEDVIECYVVDQIHARSTSSHREKISSIDFYQSLQEVIENMDLIKKEVLEIKETLGVQQQLCRISIPSGSSSRFSPSTVQNTMVGFDDVFNEMLDKLTSQQSNRQIIPIVGMGGIGKTTLARNMYVHPLIVSHFDILGWVTVSKEYSLREILVDLLLCLKTEELSREKLSQITEEKLGLMLHQGLSRRRYLIVMDDLWSIEAWDKVMLFLPDNNNRSRLIITTRLSNLAFQLADPHDGLEMKLLDEDKSWNLLCKNVFGDQVGCPVELEEIGKKIAKNCKGLPLSIVVIGGVLSKSRQTREYWEYMARNLNSSVNLENNEHCLKILYTSYNQLPVHLKSCFLYMGVFREDRVIGVFMLIKLWVAEGFLKPESGKSLEVIAEEYLKDLIDRNLILVHKWGFNGKMKSCKIHDLLRDLCLREAQKQKFVCVKRQHSPNNPQRRIGIHRNTRAQILDALQSASTCRSLICDNEGDSPSFDCRLDFRLLRVLKAVDGRRRGLFSTRYPLEAAFQLVNSRYLAFKADWQNPRIPSSVYNLWNLQTLIVHNMSSVISPFEIWKMPQLRHVEFEKFYLPDPPSGQIEGQDDYVLANLQTLLGVRNFKCTEEVVNRIPNIKKLQIVYHIFEEESCYYSLNNIGRLRQLESFACVFTLLKAPSRSELLWNLNFPLSLKKLTLSGTDLDWEDMSTKIGSLPLLQVLKLRVRSFKGSEWETVEGQFCSLKFLLIDLCVALKCWTTDSSHFPCLEHLVLKELYHLEEIPSSIGDIPTLQSIQLDYCGESAVISAKRLLEEQEGYGNEDLQIRVRLKEKNQVLVVSLAGPNFHVS